MDLLRACELNSFVFVEVIEDKLSGTLKLPNQVLLDLSDQIHLLKLNEREESITEQSKTKDIFFPNDYKKTIYMWIMKPYVLKLKKVVRIGETFMIPYNLKHGTFPQSATLLWHYPGT